MVKLQMHGPFSVFWGEPFVRVYFNQGFNIALCRASMSENVCILIEIAGKRPRQGMYLLF